METLSVRQTTLIKDLARAVGSFEVHAENIREGRGNQNTCEVLAFWGSEIRRCQMALGVFIFTDIRATTAAISGIDMGPVQ